jgi:predicted metal-binding membrane protein
MALIASAAVVALMALLFVGGVMNVLWIATISAFVLIEKIVPVGRLISRRFPKNEARVFHLQQGCSRRRTLFATL